MLLVLARIPVPTTPGTIARQPTHERRADAVLQSNTIFNRWLNVLDFAVTLLALILFALLFAAFTVLTSGIGAILFIFLIPYLVVLMATSAAFSQFCLPNAEMSNTTVRQQETVV